MSRRCIEYYLHPCRHVVIKPFKYQRDRFMYCTACGIRPPTRQNGRKGETEGSRFDMLACIIGGCL
jgi:hypothetical protein